MKERTRKAAVEHAIKCYPDESCGLIIVVEGKERYVACENKAETTSDHFTIGAEDYANAEDTGEIIAVVHSHPNAAAKASEADLVACEMSGLPWYILSIHKNEEGVIALHGENAIEPRGYEAPLVGRSFSHGVLDCYALVKDYYARELKIDLPEFERTDGWWNRGENLYMKNYEAAGFEVIKDGKLQVGDIIIMQIRAPEPNHAGVYIGDGLFLHHLYGRLSSRDVYGGYWKEATIVIIRRKPQ